MAAAIIPLISTALPVLMPVITDIVKHIEGLFAKGQGTEKMKTVIESVVPIANNLSASGKITGVVDPATIGAMVQVVVDSLKSQGLLSGQPVPTPTVVPIPASIVQSGILGQYTLIIRQAQ